jgi:hypothetical protein
MSEQMRRNLHLIGARATLASASYAIVTCRRRGQSGEAVRSGRQPAKPIPPAERLRNMMRERTGMRTPFYLPRA